MDLLENIKKLNENSTEEDIMNIVEYDFKELAYIENIDYKNIVDKNICLKYFNVKGIYSIYNWFNWRKVNGEINPNGDEWKKEFAPDSTFSCRNLEKIYKNNDLGWWDHISKFSCDTINSFFTIYSYALKVFYPDNFRILKNNSVEFVSYKENDYVSEKKLLNKGNGDFKFKEYDKINNLPCIQELARLTHSFGNFMPCPLKPYNTVKGTCNDVKDFFDLMIIKIQEENDINSWGKWFADNSEKLLIDYKDYQLLLSIDDIIKMDKNSFIEFISKINNRIRIRGLRIVKQISDNIEVKNKCDEIINKINNL